MKPVDKIIFLLSLVFGITFTFTIIYNTIDGNLYRVETQEIIETVLIYILSIIAVYIGSKIHDNEKK